MVKLIFATTAGDLEESFPVNERLGTIRRRVMNRLNLDPSKADDFAVAQDGNTFDQGKPWSNLASSMARCSPSNASR